MLTTTSLLVSYVSSLGHGYDRPVTLKRRVSHSPLQTVHKDRSGVSSIRLGLSRLGNDTLPTIRLDVCVYARVCIRLKEGQNL